MMTFLENTMIQILSNQEYQKVCVFYEDPGISRSFHDYSGALGFLRSKKEKGEVIGGTITINRDKFGNSKSRVPKRFFWATVLHEIAELNYLVPRHLRHPRLTPQSLDPWKLYLFPWEFQFYKIPREIGVHHLAALIVEYEEARERGVLEELHEVKLRAGGGIEREIVFRALKEVRNDNC